MEILNLLLAALEVTLVVVWIRALADSDGKCHSDDCEHCPYEWDCPQKRRKP